MKILQASITNLCLFGYLSSMFGSQHARLKIVVRGNEHIITPEGADMINKTLCEMIGKLSSSLQQS
jgi:hypothetical protein